MSDSREKESGSCGKLLDENIIPEYLFRSVAHFHQRTGAFPLSLVMVRECLVGTYRSMLPSLRKGDGLSFILFYFWLIFGRLSILGRSLSALTSQRNSPEKKGWTPELCSLQLRDGILCKSGPGQQRQETDGQVPGGVVNLTIYRHAPTFFCPLRSNPWFSGNECPL